MKELTIKRLINTGNYENVEFTATFDLHELEKPRMLIERAFEEFDLIIKRAGLNDLIQWVQEKETLTVKYKTKAEVKQMNKDLADKIDVTLEENDK